MADKRVFGDFEVLKFNIITKLYQAKRTKRFTLFVYKIPARWTARTNNNWHKNHPFFILLNRIFFIKYAMLIVSGRVNIRPFCFIKYNIAQNK